jgi:molecular chaperone IbpA
VLGGAYFQLVRRPFRRRFHINAFARLTMRYDYSPFFRSTVGFDRLLNLLESAEGAPGYPPYNIERSDENNYRVTIAVAGFAEKDLAIEVKDNVLTVTGKRDDADKPAYLHQGIAGRAFERQFQLAQHVVVKGARLENGLLHIDLERIVPEEKKARRITINAPELKTIEGQKAA